MTQEEMASLIALVVSICALIISVWGPVYDVLFPGDTIPLTPTGFGIIRGPSGFNFPSDHVILPLEWYNSWRAKTEIISLPYLILHKIGSNETHKFYLAGEYPDISAKSLKEPYVLEHTFLVPPSSLSKHTLVFKIEKWWDESSPNYNFKFVPGDEYEAAIGFQEEDNGKFKQHSEVPLFTMLILDTVANLSRNSSNQYWWDYFDLDRTTGKLL